MDMDMGSRFEILLFGFALYTAISVADDSGLCNIIHCGKGTCNLTSSGGLIDLKTPRCECEPGWKKPTIGITLAFLPCVIPNCTLDASCRKKGPSSAPSPEPSSANFTGLVHPCKYAFCGEGSCEKTSNFGYKCNCEAGYENLLHMTAAPCIRECSLGADCSQLGLNVVKNSSANSPPSQAYTSGSSSSNIKGSPTPTPSPVSNSGVGKSFPCQIAMAVLSLCVLLLYR